jgi:hypothetical protein
MLVYPSVRLTLRLFGFDETSAAGGNSLSIMIDYMPGLDNLEEIRDAVDKLGKIFSGLFIRSLPT